MTRGITSMGPEVKILSGVIVLLIGIILLFWLGSGVLSLVILWIGNIFLTWGAIEITTA